MLVWRSFLLLAVTTSLGLVASSARAQERVDYNRDIRPLMSNTCYKCHGPDQAERKGGLRLDEKAAATSKTESGSIALVPGKLDESEIYARITSDDPTLKMPPPDSGKTLSPQQIKLFQRWIEEGAHWQEHWSFITPQRPVVAVPAQANWVRNPIDSFIKLRLEKEGLQPAPEADKFTLIRRVTFDLTGLPPTLAEVEAFLADNSPDAYEKVVDRLLASPRFGENMARYWLDAARYGDTHGLHLDNERSMWPYRDWVIGAFNRNLPFDQFTIEQIAGDLLPEATLEQKIATGFHRCNTTTGEGGSIDEEFYVRYAVDRVETTGTVWMGLTLGCANCHSHKYDPITQKDFFQMFAFFNSLTERAMDGNVLAPPPVIKVAAAEQTAEMEKIKQELTGLDQKVIAELGKVGYVDPSAGMEIKPLERRDYVWVEDDVPAGSKAEGNTPWQWVAAPEKSVFSGSRSHIRTATGLSQHLFTGATPPLKVGEGDKLFAYVFLDPQNPPKEVMLQFNDGSWEHRIYWGDNAIEWGAVNTPARVNGGPLPPAGEWVRLEVDAAKVGLPAGAMINGWAFTQFGGTVQWDKAGINTLTPQDSMPFDSLLVWENFQRAIKSNAVPANVNEIVNLAADKRSPEQQKTLTDYFVEFVYTGTKPAFDKLHRQQADLKNKLAQVDGSIPTTMIMQELDTRKDAFMLVRGQYDKKGDKVLPGTPASLPPLAAEPEGKLPTRLSLAKWLVAPNHPLTSRVIVNRYWQQYFGTGLVETAEDFGSQGQWPSHPELLDWLATEFIGRGWDIKAMQRLMVTSATYRQSSKVSPESYQKDRSNRLLSRGARFRFDAETVRDNALAVSGLLTERVGGRSVKPYQPSGLWEAIGFTGSNTANFVQDKGDALYRRSLYTFWKRTSPPPSLSTFDAPSREACVVRRARTNTPMQALVLMNDIQYVEASRSFAERILKEGGSTPEARATFAFRRAVARPPKPTELAVLLNTYQQHLAEFQQDKDAALKLISVGEAPRDATLDPSDHAAWTMIANLLLNLSESVTKG